jgi:hypothetical protein
MSALLPKADMVQHNCDLRCGMEPRYSMTSSAMESKPDGTSMPSACAV